jgi:hypothetical protein
MTHHDPNLGEATTFPHIVYFVPLRGTHIWMVFCPEIPKEESRNCPGLDSWDFTQLELFAQTFDWDEVWSKLVALLESFTMVCCTWHASTGVESIPSPSFCHNLCYKCLNGPYEAIFDIYTSLTFQWYNEHPNAKCFDPCNRILKFLVSQRTPKSQFWECEFHTHTPSK